MAVLELASLHDFIEEVSKQDPTGTVFLTTDSTVQHPYGYYYHILTFKGGESNTILKHIQAIAEQELITEETDKTIREKTAKLRAEIDKAVAGANLTLKLGVWS